jgi:hypothetical protein
MEYIASVNFCTNKSRDSQNVSNFDEAFPIVLFFMFFKVTLIYFWSLVHSISQSSLSTYIIRTLSK